jgi:hypothetical protein
MALEVGLLLRDRVTVNRDESIEIPSGIWSGSIVSYSSGILVVELKGAATRPILLEAGDVIEIRSLPLERIISKSNGMVVTVILVPLTKYEIPYIALRKSYVAAKLLDPTGAYISPATIESIQDARDKVKQNVGLTYLSSATYTANGDSRANPLSVDYGSVIVLFCDVTAVSGTSPTLDLYVDIQDPCSGKWLNQDKFSTISAVGTYGLALNVRSNRYALRWVLGGASPSFTFSVGAVVVK